ncbi:MAG: metabolite traffic protein EboE [Phycisphaeraceae bacterium]|nr:metabolite traffic protein EboE [Phycisphaeraceae bacterium]
MLNILGPNTTLGYCTNVHAGATFDEMRSNLLKYAVPVKQRVSPGEPMGVGLWFSADAARHALANPTALIDLKSWMLGMGLLVYTANGFPYGDFHEPTVKTKVYQPDWTTPERYDYTLTLARVLAELLPEGAEGSISTLPLGWPAHSGGTDQDLHRVKSAAAGLMHNLVHELARLELDTGKHIHIDLEPEPGCILDTAKDVCGFFTQYLLDSPDDVSIRGYLRVCHDVCHSAVMFEPQRDAVRAYREARIEIGKVQLSSAVRVDFEAKDANDKAAALQQLKSFAEDRYQHQTTARLPDGTMHYFDDLPEALTKFGDEPQGEWRIHFHVPVYVESFGQLEATQGDIGDLIRAVQGDEELHHYEVETYAWDVLPEELQREELPDGIADELKWVRDTFGK